jgi:hypothetical protein
MKLRLILFTGGLLAALLGGCATPQYQKSYRHEPPVDPQGQACVQGCEEERQACQADCQARYRICLAEIEPQVEGRYLEALKQYEMDLMRYASSLRHYEMQLDFYWPGYYWPGYYGHPRFGYWYPWNPWPAPAVWLPPVPVQPTRDSVRAHLAKINCQDDCGCLPAYDACFIACGGKIIAEDVCVKNCPERSSP